MSDKAKNSYMHVVDQSWNRNRLRQPVKQVMLKALPSNVDTVWIGIDAAAQADFSFPMIAEDSITFPIDQLDRLEFNFINAADKIIMIYGV